MAESREISMYQACLMHARADRALRAVVANQLEEFDLTMMEWLLMATVSGAPKDGMTMSAVASALNVTLPQVTALANSLVKSRLMKQKVNVSDKRSRYLTVSITGKRLIGKVEESINRSMQKWLEDIPKDELIVYMATVEKVANLPTNNKL